MWDSYTNIVVIFGSSGLALLWAFVNALSINSIKIKNSENSDEESGKLI